MNTNLQSSGYLPTTSPYADAREVDPLPADVVDWIYIELRVTADGAAVAERSALMRNDGVLIDDDGSTEVLIPGLGEGSYYVVVRHRNHLDIMSAEAVSLSSGSAVEYDFTTAQSQAYGTDPQIELSGGSYGMVAGDASETFGLIDSADRAVVWNARTGTCYLIEDITLNGLCDSEDRAVVYNNRTRTSQVP
jgi:hypothetical protein